MFHVEKVIMGRKQKWTEELVLESISNFIKENDRLPYTKEIDQTPGLPKRLTITNLFGMTYDDVCKVNFPLFYRQNQSSKYKNYSISNLIDDFKTQYTSMGEPSIEYYDSHRRKGSPQCRHICKLLGITYNELLHLCGFEVKKSSKFSKKKPKPKIINYQVSLHPYSLSTEQAVSVFKDVEEIIKKYE